MIFLVVHILYKCTLIIALRVFLVCKSIYFLINNLEYFMFEYMHVK